LTQVLFLERFPSKSSKLPNFYDKAIQDGGIAIDQDAYTEGLDRLYDVRGLANMHVTMKNTGGSNGLTYTIENASKEYTDITTLVDSDFSEIKGDTNVALSAEDFSDIIDISPESTAIRIRVKRQTAGQDTTLAGTVSVD
jgi:hypothetical protein